MPNTESSVAEAERRAWNYWFIDGLPNLVAGLGCLVVSGAFLLLIHYRQTRSPYILGLAFLTTAVWTLVFLRLPQTLGWLKSRITYPRTGFAAPPYFTEAPTQPSGLAMLNLSPATEKSTTLEILRSEDLRQRTLFLLAIFALAVLVGIFVRERPLCALAGLASGIVIMLAARRDPRRSWAAVYSLFFAQLIFAFNFRGIAEVERGGYFMAGVGLALLVAGASTLVRYLRSNPARQA